MSEVAFALHLSTSALTNVGPQPSSNDIVPRLDDGTTPALAFVELLLGQQQSVPADTPRATAPVTHSLAPTTISTALQPAPGNALPPQTNAKQNATALPLPQAQAQATLHAQALPAASEQAVVEPAQAQGPTRPTATPHSGSPGTASMAALMHHPISAIKLKPSQMPPSPGKLPIAANTPHPYSAMLPRPTPEPSATDPSKRIAASSSFERAHGGASPSMALASATAAMADKPITQTAAPAILTQPQAAPNSPPHHISFELDLSALLSQRAEQSNHPSAQAPTVASGLGRQGQWLGELGQGIGLMLRTQAQSAQVKLWPRNLGSIEIQVAIRAEQVEVSIGASHALMVDELAEAGPRLRQILAEQGLDLSHLEIDHSKAQQRDHRRSSNGAQTTGGDDGVADIEAESATGSAPPSSIASKRLVDIFA